MLRGTLNAPLSPRSVPERALDESANQYEEMIRTNYMPKADEAFRRQLAGYSLATAEITYHYPDAHGLLQTFVWQEYDMAPKFPVLRKFLDWWSKELDGPLHSVRIAHSALIRPAEFQIADFEVTIH